MHACAPASAAHSAPRCPGRPSPLQAAAPRRPAASAGGATRRGPPAAAAAGSAQARGREGGRMGGREMEDRRAAAALVACATAARTQGVEPLGWVGLGFAVTSAPDTQLPAHVAPTCCASGRCSTPPGMSSRVWYCRYRQEAAGRSGEKPLGTRPTDHQAAGEAARARAQAPSPRGSPAVCQWPGSFPTWGCRKEMWLSSTSTPRRPPAPDSSRRYLGWWCGVVFVGGGGGAGRQPGGCTAGRVLPAQAGSEVNT